MKATVQIRDQLFTVDEERVHAFELDPCGTNGGRWGKEMYNGVHLGQGNCTAPNFCTCLCRARYNADECSDSGLLCDVPWIDPLNRPLPAGYVYGSKICFSGFEGIKEATSGKFKSCHLQIYTPDFFENYSVSFITILTMGALFAICLSYYLRQRRKRNVILQKAEKLRQKRMEAEEESLMKPQKGILSYD